MASASCQKHKTFIKYGKALIFIKTKAPFLEDCDIIIQNHINNNKNTKSNHLHVRIYQSNNQKSPKNFFLL